MEFISNPQIELAFEYVRYTGKNIFLTGKAGTGKTTFLHRIKSEGFKRMVVTAPTGVAAINAGGMTLHSFFQLPFGPCVPGVAREDSRQRRFTGTKINLIRSLDLLVIDEISMVRADVLDAVDEVLRRYRNPYQPFGGVQLLMIGDLHQLPPVVKQDEWDMLRAYYQTPYFFGSNALRQSDPVTIELKHIYRQSDQQFIDLLNKVRDNKLDASVFDALNSRYRANFSPSDEEGYITLTSHNVAAQHINAQRLTEIPGPPQVFRANIEGDFPAHAYPTDELLECKPGAQVMFVKNDISVEKRYFNGKIGRIQAIEDDTIIVKCPGDDALIYVGTVEWTNVKYLLNEQTKEVKEDIVGKFIQYPLKLAWAITIHKSQGLTFDRAIIDAEAAFAHGQVYVALSRCKSFEGIVLRSRIGQSSVKTDSVVKNYTDEAEKNAPDEAHLQQSKRAYQASLLLELFDFRAMKRYFDKLNRQFIEHSGSLQGSAHTKLKALAALAKEQVFDMADKFLPHLRSYFAQADLPETYAPLQERLQKASAYFSEKLNNGLLPEATGIHILSDNKAVRKTALEALDNLQKEIYVKNACFQACLSGFTSQGLIHAKTHAELDYHARKTTTQPPPAQKAAADNTPHPELYIRLSRWREETAADMGADPYEVLPSRSLLELVQFLPTDTASLKKIKGIGEGKSKRFGPAIIATIEQYCNEKQIPANLMPVTAPKPDTKALSRDLFMAGKSLDEIASERGFVRSTIEGHLAHFVRLGEIDVHEILGKAVVEEITEFFQENPSSNSAEARAHFNEKYSYGEIKLVQAHLQSLLPSDA